MPLIRDSAGGDVSTNTIMDTNRKRWTNKRWPEALKREIVAASFAPGASVWTVARQYDVNSNQVFSWRRRFVQRWPSLVNSASLSNTSVSLR